MLIGGFDIDGTPRLFKTEPSGAYYEYLVRKSPFSIMPLQCQANSTGRGEKSVREYLEEHYGDDTTGDEAAVLKFVVKSLSQVRTFLKSKINLNFRLYNPVPRTLKSL